MATAHDLDGAGAAIQLRGVSKNFGAKPVLTGVDLEIVAGETHVILGRSGSGKSVLLKLICSLLVPDAGTIFVGGLPVHPAKAAQRRQALSQIQMLFQGGALFDSLSVAQNVAFHAVEHGRIRPAEAADYAQEYLEMVDLAGAGPLMPAELSGGMRKRAALARALAARPRIMLYDEPTTGLDPLTSEVINQLIRETQRRFGVTSLVVTHDLRSAQEVGDRCSFLEEGQILETTVPRRLGQSAHPVIREFSIKAAVSF
jgi:phospholipid/cholesterol/gamma-HCH transport system ATP-binding protein